MECKLAAGETGPVPDRTCARHTVANGIPRPATINRCWDTTMQQTADYHTLPLLNEDIVESEVTAWALLVSLAVMFSFLISYSFDIVRATKKFSTYRRATRDQDCRSNPLSVIYFIPCLIKCPCCRRCCTVSLSLSRSSPPSPVTWTVTWYQWPSTFPVDWQFGCRNCAEHLGGRCLACLQAN